MTDPTPESIDAAIVGGGVIGLAAACAVAARGRTACVIERLPRPGLEASTRNSGVVHAGIYYPRDSLKAVLCVEGRERLYAFCDRHGVPCLRRGKLIVAADASEIGALEALAARGHANGVTDLEMVDRAFVRRREPHVEAAAAIWSPSTGVVEAEAYVRALARAAAAREVALLPGAGLEAGTARPGGIALRTARETILARAVVNAAGLRADEVLGRARRRILHDPPGPRRLRGADAGGAASGERPGLPAPGSERARARSAPDPHHPGQRDAGTHRPLPGAQGRLRVEPRTARPVPRRRPAAPARAPAGPAPPGGSGIRARAAPAGRTFSDFLIRRDRRQPRLVQAAGIDSPGLTASLAVAERVADLVDETL